MRLTLREETFPIAGRFTIARGSKTEARVIYVELEDQGHIGRGEAVPYARYGESIAQSLADIEAARHRILRSFDGSPVASPCSSPDSS